MEKNLMIQGKLDKNIDVPNSGLSCCMKMLFYYKKAF